MKKIVLLTSAFLLAGCASNLEQDAVRSAQIAITTYVDVYQPAVLAYGRLPQCGPSAPVICHDIFVYADLKAADLATTKSILAARAVISGKPGAGTELSEALAAISAAERSIASKGIIR